RKEAEKARPCSADPIADKEDDRHDGNNEDANQRRILNQGGSAVVPTQTLQFNEPILQSVVPFALVQSKPHSCSRSHPTLLKMPIPAIDRCIINIASSARGGCNAQSRSGLKQSRELMTVLPAKKSWRRTARQVEVQRFALTRRVSCRP